MRTVKHKPVVAFVLWVILLIGGAFTEVRKLRFQSLLWKIEGNDLAKPSFLFGTVHMVEADHFQMAQKVLDAIDQTEQTYLEIDMDAPDLLAQSQKYMMSNKSISSQIPPADTAYVSAVFRKKLGVGLAEVDYVKPMMLIAGILQASFTKPIVSFEGELIKLNQQAKKEVLGLSTIEEQYSFMEKIFRTEDLAKYLKEMESVPFPEILAKIYQAYEQEDIEAIDAILKDFSSSEPEAYRQLLIVRNHLWADRIPAIIKEKPTFIGVGSAHLSGEDGLINLLRKKGYKLIPVF